jgi:hypothetical protein
MSDDNAAAKNRNRRIAEELAEADEPRNRAQAQLDYWWEAARASEEAETDMFFVGGFQEFHSKTPSFHKTRRDRDWRVR